MKRTSLLFQSPYLVSFVEEWIPTPAPRQCLVRTLVSAISSGTELLVYRGQWPEDTPVDDTIPSLARAFSYPLKYGYSAVGLVVEVGAGVPPDLLGARVFCFNPHETHFLVDMSDLILIPSQVTAEDAVFLSNMETAVGLVMDGNPLLGEAVVVFGLGVVGLLTTSVLGKFPLSVIISLDGYAVRREKSLSLGAHYSFDPNSPQTKDQLAELPEFTGPVAGADLIYELSGNPQALNEAILVGGFDSRIVVGSWYGSKRADLSLGNQFHRSRMRIMSSQVSRLGPSLTGRWDKKRRMDLAWRLIHSIRPSCLITHRIPFSRAGEAFELLHGSPGQAIQVILQYEDET
jgi:threonine dehydrogenase-like Zn-dependent dehydrogenase